jgi:hypothetical protein
VGVVFEDRPRLAREQRQQRTQDVLLEVGLVRRAEGPAELERDPEGARRLDLLGVLADQADAGGRDAFRFEVV